jgi:hypothetical protein
MSEPSRSSVELEPVTCWPLILGAVGFASLAILTAGAFAAWSALFPAKPPAPTPEAETAAVSVRPAPIELSEAPRATESERVVKVKRDRWLTFTPRYPREEVLKPPPRAGVRPGIAKPRRSASDDSRPVALGEPTLQASLLKQSRQLDLDQVAGSSKALLEAGKKHLLESRKKAKTGKEARLPGLTRAIARLLRERDDLRGLPLVAEAACQTGPEAARVIARFGRNIRGLQESARAARQLARMRSGGNRIEGRAIERFEPEITRYLAVFGPPGKDAALSVAPLEQLIQIERKEVRLALADFLSAVAGRESTAALARRAVFDLSPSVRREAVAALKMRPLDHPRKALLAALRHPWAPAADHAAVALADLNDQEALPALKKLLDQPDPAAPSREGKKWVVSELVRVNHLRNCALCHAPSVSSRDPARGLIPEPGQPLPEEEYYGGNDNLPAVRADIVYFRQDFSVMHEVENPDKWPTVQRFDYLVRKRELTGKEVPALDPAGPAKKPTRKSYPQREAVRYAIAALREKALLGAAR